MRFLKSKLAAYLTDIICCILMGASVLAVLLPSAGLGSGFGGYLLLMAADLILIVLFTRKWWLFPVFAGTAAVLTLLIVTALGAHREFWSYIDGFFRWCATSYPESSPYSTTGNIIAVQLVITLPVAAVLYLFYRRLFFFPILPPAAVALLLWVNFNNSEAFWPVFFMVLTVIFLSIAKTTGRRINKRLPEEDRISSALLVMTSVVIVPVIVFLAFAVSPKDDGEWQIRGLYNIVEDLSEYFGWSKGREPVQGTFSIGVSGFSPLENRLGGNILPDNTKVMSVVTGFPVRLKGAVYNTYDGQSWYDTGTFRRYRFIGSLWQEQRNKAFGFDKPAGAAAKELFAKLTRSAELDIRYTERGRTLFAAGQVKSLESKKLDISDIFFNHQAELFTSESQKSMQYTLNTIVFDRSRESFDSDMAALEQLTKNEPDGSLEEIEAEYLQLPDSLPHSVRDKAKEITKGCASAYQKAKAIELWLSKNCTYTLSPGKPPEGADFVEHFLQNREGYCVYFASAMTVMARSVGLPARFVAGYAIKRDPASDAQNAYVATNSMAHAWTEVYFRGIGWVTFDAAGWDFSEEAIVEYSITEVISSPSPTPVSAPETEPENPRPQSGVIPDEVKVLLAALAFLAAALAVFTAVRFVLLLTGAKGYYRRLHRKYASAGDRLGACYSKIVRQAAFLGIKQETSDTITSFSRRVDVYLETNEMSAVCGSVTLMRFGQQEPDETDVKAMCEFSAALEKRLRLSLGISSYIWRRIIIGR